MNNEEKILLLLENLGKDVGELKHGQESLRQDVQELKQGYESLRQGQESLRQDVQELKHNYEFIRQVVVRIENLHEERLNAIVDGQTVQEEETGKLKLRVTKLEEVTKIRQVK